MAKVPRVNKGECISCGVCVDTCPAVFRFDGVSRVVAYD
jgi:ferredoxin